MSQEITNSPTIVSRRKLCRDFRRDFILIKNGIVYNFASGQQKKLNLLILKISHFRFSTNNVT